MKKELKGFVCGVVLTALLSCGVSAAGVWDNISVLKNDIKVVVNGSEVTADNFVYEDTTYLPLRAVSEALNQPVNYDEITNTAYIGERKDSDVVKSKYIPPQEMIDRHIVTLIDGEYYVHEIDLTVYYTEKGYLDDKNTYVECIPNTNKYVFHLKNNIEKAIPCYYFEERGQYLSKYDDFVDEIEPLLK